MLGLFFFIDITATGMKSWRFVETAAREYGVVTLPGEACGMGWERSVRLAFGNVALDRLEQAIDRLEEMWKAS